MAGGSVSAMVAGCQPERRVERGNVRVAYAEHVEVSGNALDYDLLSLGWRGGCPASEIVDGEG